MGGASRVSQDGSRVSLRLPVRVAQAAGGPAADERQPHDVGAPKADREESGASPEATSRGTLPSHSACVRVCV